ncbi:hypothetical protein HMPREF9103_00153 [Lentilactobacillus parafarraginis F0439]|uniref:Uncharacterized protein n=1 Tax=Lentilactobacillus parafarraginis F0439 TaxID=797515 RepID=G9ZKA5_9LACO|nr:hypothetical protein HMPREF9103_00153 [Lentilactobacillus parafarraginis F0439]
MSSGQIGAGFFDGKFGGIQPRWPTDEGLSYKVKKPFGFLLKSVNDNL